MSHPVHRTFLLLSFVALSAACSSGKSSEDGDIDYSFTDGSLVKRILVTGAQLKQLSNGRLCIIRLDQHYELIPTLVAEKIRMRTRVHRSSVISLPRYLMRMIPTLTSRYLMI